MRRYQSPEEFQLQWECLQAQEAVLGDADMDRIKIGVYRGGYDEAAFYGIFCPTLIYRNKCLDFRGSLHLFT